MQQFTNAVEISVQNTNWHGALVNALILPDIAGWIEEPNASSTARYTAWVNRFLTPKYTRNLPGRPSFVFLSGDGCYALRCSLLHEGRDEIAHQRARDALDRFEFTSPIQGTIHCNHTSG